MPRLPRLTQERATQTLTLILRVVLALVAAVSFSLTVITELCPLAALQPVPVWSWYVLTACACVAFAGTWIRSRPSAWPQIIKLRLKVAGLKLLIWVMKRPTFQYLVVRPVALGALTWVIWKIFAEPDKLHGLDPRVAPMVVQLKASLERRTKHSLNETDRDRSINLNRAMTWGVAGVAIVLLTTVIVATHPSTDKAALFAGACFAFAIPILIACGFVQMSHADTTIEPPTVREVWKVTNRIYLAYVIVCFGMAAMLWSYDWIVSVIFVVSLYLAFRLIRRALKGRTAKPDAERSSSAYLKRRLRAAKATARQFERQK